MKNELQEYATSLGVHFKDFDLLQQVFVHRSYLNEHRSFRLSHNERLEFLGDAVLELVVTEHLYKNYKNPEGELTNWRSALVRGEMLARIANEISMNPHLLLSKGEQKSQGKARQLILANTFEAFVGALYLDQGYEVVQEFIGKYLLVYLEEVFEKRLHVDTKSDFQEKSQEAFGLTPSYRVITTSGPDHDKKFEVAAFLGETQAGIGAGRSKQKAEQAAASAALEHWEELIKKLRA